MTAHVVTREDIQFLTDIPPLHNELGIYDAPNEDLLVEGLNEAPQILATAPQILATAPVESHEPVAILILLGHINLQHQLVCTRSQEELTYESEEELRVEIGNTGRPGKVGEGNVPAFDVMDYGAAVAELEFGSVLEPHVSAGLKE